MEVTNEVTPSGSLFVKNPISNSAARTKSASEVTVRAMPATNLSAIIARTMSVMINMIENSPIVLENTGSYL